MIGELLQQLGAATGADELTDAGEWLANPIGMAAGGAAQHDPGSWQYIAARAAVNPGGLIMEKAAEAGERQRIEAANAQAIGQLSTTPRAPDLTVGIALIAVGVALWIL